MRLSTRWVLLVLGLATLAAAQAPLEEVVRSPEGEVLARLSWVTRTITAVGRAALDPPQPNAFLIRAAKLDAYANLARAAQAAWVDPSRRVGTLAGAEPAFRAYLSAYVRYATFGELVRGNDGFARLTAEVPLFGVQPDETRLLGTELYRRDDVWAQEVTPRPADTGPYTGLLLDASGCGAPGAFAPLVRDTEGRVVWHVECADRALADRAGAVEYRDQAEAARQASRAGDRPLVVKVLAVRGPELVVSVADGLRIAPPQQAARPGLAFVALDPIRTITPVSPFQRVCCLSTPPEGDQGG